MTFFVAGIPQPQGSKTAGITKDGRPFVRDKNPRPLREWRDEVARIAEASWAYGMPLSGPVRVRAVFVMPRPDSVTRPYPSVRPDIDKLARALLDGLTDAKCVWGDDAQVVQLDTEKVYGSPPGVHVDVTPVPADLLTT